MKIKSVFHSLNFALLVALTALFTNAAQLNQKKQTVAIAPFENLILKYQYQKGNLLSQYGDWFGPKQLSVVKGLPEFQLAWLELNFNLSSQNTPTGNAIQAYLYIDANLREIREARQTHIFIKLPDSNGEMRTIDLANRYSEEDELTLVFLQADLLHFLKAHPTDAQLSLIRFLQFNRTMVGSFSTSLIQLGLNLKQDSSEAQIEFLLSRQYDPLYRSITPLVTEELSVEHLRTALKRLKDDHHVPFSRVAPYSEKTFSQLRSPDDKYSIEQVYCEFYEEACSSGSISNPNSRSLSSMDEGK